MIKSITLSLLILVLSINMFAQKSDVLAVFEKYHVDTAVLNPNLGLNSLNYAYHSKREVTTDGSYKVYLSDYDPAKTGLQRWTLVSVDGKEPQKGEIKNFNKEHEFVPAYKIDEASLKVAKDDDSMLIVTYMYDASTVDDDHQFLKDCQYTVFINKGTGRLESVLQKNLKDVKIKFVKATKLEGKTMYAYNEKDNKYTISSAEVVAIVKLLGRSISIVTTDVYTYK